MKDYTEKINMDRQRYSITYNIKDLLVLLFYRMFSFIPVAKRIRDEHNNRNIPAWNKSRLRFPHDKSIEHQPALSDFAYGIKYNADYNSCEVIALYNALISMGLQCDFPDLIENFERKGITCFGAFGTSPYALIKYIKDLGFSTESYSYKKWQHICSSSTENALYNNFVNYYDAFIYMSYNNAHKIRDMIHTMCVTKEGEHFQTHNDYEGAKCYATLKDAIIEYKGRCSRMILIIGIKKC